MASWEAEERIEYIKEEVMLNREPLDDIIKEIKKGNFKIVEELYIEKKLYHELYTSEKIKNENNIRRKNPLKDLFE